MQSHIPGYEREVSVNYHTIIRVDKYNANGGMDGDGMTGIARLTVTCHHKELLLSVDLVRRDIRIGGDDLLFRL
jgi:hypothetical protein